ncbi:N-acetylmuramoyl-L-alanine amidase [Flavobacterium croceum DSM 17960]|uniref:N-acetylmuramoyl-L-alanine amidase n=1 Tax=Flavobacterium croceum DSM 17960 TaxID=1121886 RepID=A0A2S4NAS6_9FLAO|nr:N-acetylmuramoyl-L-alanine amidase [Flavobacterium croceum]POS02806.1 N-acetylmuramoyl-L-alanine amidase [Flavobacterium croceum DSM 17960]
MGYKSSVLNKINFIPTILSNNRYFSMFLLLFFIQLGYSQSAKFKVTLDAGHGDHDYGAIYGNCTEKNINLAIVLKVGKILEKQPNIAVTYTRKTDVFIDLVERANIANRADANLFVSIHCNASKNPAAFGSETFIMGLTKTASSMEVAKRENSVITLEKDYKKKYEGFDPSRPESIIGTTLVQEEYVENSIMLAGKIQEKFKSIERKSRGIGQEPFMVLHKAYMPRVLIETGFISNETEGAYLNSDEGQDEMAEAIATAIIEYKKEYFDGGDYEELERPSRILKEETKKEQAKKDSIKKEIVKKESQPNKIESKNTAELKLGIFYKVQISAGDKKMELSPSNFKGLKDISMEKDGKYYKYYYGETSEYENTKELLKKAKEKGYKSAFVVAFKDGKVISVNEALKQK